MSPPALPLPGARASVVTFVALTYVATWALWSLLWLADIPVSDLRFRVVAGLGMLVPGLVALFCARKVPGGLWRALTLTVRPPPRFMAMAALLFPPLVLLAAGLSLALGLARFDSQFTMLREALEAQTRAAGRPMPTIWLGWLVLGQFAAGVVIGPLVNLPAAMGEELGWRGFLLPRLRAAGLSWRGAVLVSGVLWGLWHAPVLLRGYNYPGHPVAGTLLFIPGCVLLAIPFSYLRIASGSVWTPALAHGSLNAIAPVALLLLRDYNPLWAGTVVSAVGLGLVGLVGVCLWRSGRLADWDVRVGLAPPPAANPADSDKK